jgi:hypothetical protein
MKPAARVIVPLSLLTVSCSDTSQQTSASTAVQQGYDMSRMDREELCSSIRRVSKDAINGFAALKAEERTIPNSKTASMSRVYREYKENETWFHMPGASDCYISSSLDRPPGTRQWAYYKCRWPYPALDEAKSEFRVLNRYIEFCVDAEDIEVRQEKDGHKISRRIFRAPTTSLNLYTEYYTEAFQGDLVGPPVLDVSFQASIKRQ